MRIALNMILVAVAVILFIYGMRTPEPGVIGDRELATLSERSLWMTGAGALCAAFGMVGALRMMRRTDV